MKGGSILQRILKTEFQNFFSSFIKILIFIETSGVSVMVNIYY